MIFGLGLPRTGTKSLQKALTILGYKAHHGAYEHWPDIPPNVDAVIETPFTVHYQYVEENFPDAQVIITCRDYNSWMTSVKRWMTRGPSPAVHTKGYRQRVAFIGVPHFDEKLLRSLYVQHYNTSQLFFKDSALLLPVGSGWGPLCEFLDKPIPKEAYPHENRS